ncbi:MAG: hypothetical protein QGF81_05840 [Dehalococcoidia bacterium]|nr:hypothetical protein [Dehalococcoidia bacterium]
MFTPTLVKVLRYFQEHPAGGSCEEIIGSAQMEPRWVEQALCHLGQNNLVAISDGTYQPEPSLDEFAVNMFRLYDKINRRNQRELLVRGLLSAVRERGYLMNMESLLKLLEEQGFEREETVAFVQEEVSRGHVGKIRVSVGSRRVGILPPLPCLPLSDLRPTDLGQYDEPKGNWRERGFTVWEGDYLIANYPVDLSTPAMLFLDVEGSEIKMRLREETLQAWSRFRSGDYFPRP